MPRASSLSAMAKSAGPQGTCDGSAEAVRTLDASPFMPRPYRPSKPGHRLALDRAGVTRRVGRSARTLVGSAESVELLAGIGRRDGHDAGLAEMAFGRDGSSR
jgi:hypothetical protein